MYKTPSKGMASASASASTSAPFTPRKKGLFEDGQWLCDCRKPAPYLQVKKEGPNKGKYFYTCDKRKCGFFLFDHDAKVRERDALLLHNCRSENGLVGRVQAKGDPPATPAFPARTQGGNTMARSAPPQQRLFRSLPRLSQDSDGLSFDSDEESQALSNNNYGLNKTPSSSQTLRNSSGSKASGGPAAADRMPGFTFQQQQQQQQQHASPATPSAGRSNNNNNRHNKRKRGVFLDDDSDEDLFGGSDLDDPDTARQLAALADAGAPRAIPQTPSAGRGSAMLPTPVTRNTLLVAAEGRAGGPSAKRTRFADGVKAEDDDDDYDDDDLAGGGPARLLFPARAAGRAPGSGPLGLGLGLGSWPGEANATTPPAGGATSDPPHPRVADEVMGLLAGQPLSEASRARVRAALERHDLRVRGVARGRDAARAALGARDERVAELQARVVALENARRLDRARLREVSEGLVRLSQEEE